MYDNINNYTNKKDYETANFLLLVWGHKTVLIFFAF